jgi:hypothetical protein
MTVSDFANHYRLKLINDSCDDPIIQGRLGKDANISGFRLWMLQLHRNGWH